MMHPNKLAHAAEERANGSRRAFLKYVFMEVRVPLNSIIMSLQILDHDEAVPEGSRETVAMMREAAQFMAQTLNDVFSMQKIEEGTFDIEYGECEVDAMLRTYYVILRSASLFLFVMALSLLPIYCLLLASSDTT